MFIRITAKRWMHEDVRFQIPDLTQFPRQGWLNGLVGMADRHFEDLYANKGLSIELVNEAIHAFLKEVGDGATLRKSFPEAEEAGDDWRVFIEMETPENQAEQGQLLDKFLADLPKPARSERMMIHRDGSIRPIED